MVEPVDDAEQDRQKEFVGFVTDASIVGNVAIDLDVPISSKKTSGYIKCLLVCGRINVGKRKIVFIKYNMNGDVNP